MDKASDRIKKADSYYAELLYSRKHSDVTIRLSDGVDWPVHKVILEKCEFFRGLLDSGMVESRENLITMPDDPASAVLTLIRHLYHYEYWPFTGDSSDKLSRWNCIVIDYAVAEKYGALDLKQQIVASFKRRLVLDGTPGLLEEFYDIAGRIYQSTISSDRGLRDPFVAFGKDHQTFLTASTYEKQAAEIFSKHPAFAWDFLGGKRETAPAAFEKHATAVSKRSHSLNTSAKKRHKRILEFLDDASDLGAGSSRPASAASRGSILASNSTRTTTMDPPLVCSECGMEHGSGSQGQDCDELIPTGDGGEYLCQGFLIPL